MPYFFYFNKVTYKGKGAINYFFTCNYIIIRGIY